MTFAKFADLLSLEGQLLEGVSFDDSATLQALGERVMKPHCAVYSWIVLDVTSASDIDNPGSASLRVECWIPVARQPQGHRSCRWFS